jgi:hypothetical protein
MRKIVWAFMVAPLCVICALAWAASTSKNIAINVILSSQPTTITALALSNMTYTSSTPATVVGNLVLSGANNSATTFALGGPDAARFQLSSPCTGTSCSLLASGIEPDGYHDGKFLVFITPTLTGATGSGVVYPFVVNETVSCDQTVASGGTQTEIASTISAAPTNGVVCFADAGNFTITSPVTVNRAVRLTGGNAKTMPAITVSGQITAFSVTAGGVQIDHLGATGATTTSSSDCCGGYSGFVSVGSVSGFTATYNKSASFMCEYLFFGTSNVIAQYNYMSGDGEAGIVCDPCFGAIISNNVVQDMVDVGEPNTYPFVISGDSASTGVIDYGRSSPDDGPAEQHFLGQPS